MQVSCRFENVRAERAIQCVIAMGCHQDLLTREASDQQTVVKLSRSVSQLNHISGFQGHDISRLREGAASTIVYQKLIEILYPRPGRGAVIRRLVQSPPILEKS